MERKVAGARAQPQPIWIALAAAALLASALPVSAQTSIEVEMMVSLASDEAGPVDPRARKIDRRLKHEFRYESLQVIESKRQRVAINSVMTLRLPNGKQARVRPMALDERGALLAVDIEGAVKVDARARSGHLLVFGAGRHGNGRLVVSIEARF
jgi:hypothetical protein